MTKWKRAAFWQQKLNKNSPLPRKTTTAALPSFQRQKRGRKCLSELRSFNHRSNLLPSFQLLSQNQQRHQPP